jgi:hypothetical protein
MLPELDEDIAALVERENVRWTNPHHLLPNEE